MTLQPIPLSQLLIALIPALLVIGLMWRWQLGYGKAIYGLARMLVQLLLLLVQPQLLVELIWVPSVLLQL